MNPPAPGDQADPTDGKRVVESSHAGEDEPRETVFPHWTHQPLFRDAWMRASYTFNPLFQQVEETLAEAPMAGATRNIGGGLQWGNNRLQDKANVGDRI
jgi:hypothetical protein